jgi:hypothetical protein
MGGNECGAVTFMHTPWRATDRVRTITYCVASYLGAEAVPALLDWERARAATGYFISLVNAFTNSRVVKSSAKKISERVS